MIIYERCQESGRGIAHCGSKTHVTEDCRDVTEAVNGEGEMFGEERLWDVIAGSQGGSADETIGAICGALAAFTGGAEPADDVTVVVVRRR
jgi:hypothetical protein